MSGLQWARAQWDRIAGMAAVALGAIAIVVGWNRVSAEALTAQQVPYIVSGGIGGLFLLGVGATLWLSADLRDEWRKLDAIERAIGATSDEQPATADPFTARPPVVEAPKRARTRPLASS